MIMDSKIQPITRVWSIVAVVALLSSALYAHNLLQNAGARSKSKPSSLKQGILLLAHGGNQNWNDAVNHVASQVSKTVPAEVAFGMATKRTIQGAVDRLLTQGVEEIIAVPLFVSSHSSIITSTQYLLGLRKEAPSALAIYAKMDHGSGGHHDGHSNNAGFDPRTPVHSPVPIRMTAALDRHPIVADILLAHALSISRSPKNEVVIIVAHGPVSDEENAKWLADMSALVERIDKASNFRRIEYMTVRDDAPEPLRSQATAELRGIVGRAAKEESRVLIVPLLLSYGGIEEGIKKRLEGLSYTICPQGLLPDERLTQWVLLSAGSLAQTGEGKRR
jgi:sirohydrochlorin ferrochelatase